MIDIVIGIDLVEFDMDVIVGGNYKLGEIFRMKFLYFKVDFYLFILVELVVSKLYGIDKIYKGRIISRDEFVVLLEKVNKFREIFFVECVEMEGVVVVYVCEIMNIFFVVIRLIFDKVDDEVGMIFDEFVKIVVKYLKLIVEGILLIIK